MTPAQNLAKKLKRRPRDDTRSRPLLECKLKELRKSLGLRQLDVAESVGISRAWYCEIERGSETSLTLARKLAAFFGVGIDRIWPNLGSQKSKMA